MERPGNPEFTVESLKAWFASLGRTFPTDLGIEPLEINDELSRGRIVVDERHLHPGKLVHGGVWVGLGDTVAAWQTFRHLPPGYDFTTIELKLNAFAPGASATSSRPRRATCTRAARPTRSRSRSSGATVAARRT